MAIFFSYFNECRHSAQQKLCSMCPPSSYYIRRSHNSARTFALLQLSSPALKPRYEQISCTSVSSRSGELLIGIQLHNNSLQWPNKILDAAFLTCHLQKWRELLALIMTRLPRLFVLVCAAIFTAPATNVYSISI